MAFLTITEPTANVANLEIVSKADLHAFRASAAETGDDARLTLVVNYVNRRAFEEMQRRFIKATGTNYDIVLDGPLPARPLPLPFRPIKTLVSVARGHYDGSGWVADYVFLSSELVVENDKGLITTVGPNTFPMGRRSVRVVLDAGWDTFPHDLQFSLTQWASVVYDRLVGLRIDMITQAFEGGATSYTFGEMPESTRSVLTRYTRKDEVV